MKANINVREVLLKRGNTTVSSNYTGPVGEVTVDTTLHSIRVHDGITPGGFLQASTGAVDVLTANVATLFANAAFQQTQINALIASPNTSSGPTPPADPIEGTLWYDTTGGRLYVYFDGYWVDASPESVYTLPTASDTVLGGIRLGNSLSIDGDGVVDIQLDNVHGNLTFTNQTISGTNINGDIVFAPNGTGAVEVPTLKINGYAEITTGEETITNIVNRLVLASSDSSANVALPSGTYGNPSTIPAPWAAYEFTTVPSPTIQLGDAVAGSGIPAMSEVVYVGTGLFNKWVVVNLTSPFAVTPGTPVTVTRERTNDAFILDTIGDSVDISLRPSTPSGRVTAGSSIHPLVSDTYNLGTPARRWREIWLGAGTLYVQDETLGIDLAIGAKDGNLYVAGASGLTVGEFTLSDNNIFITDFTRDINIGRPEASGNVNFNRPIKVISGETGFRSFEVTREGQTTISTPNLAIGQSMLDLTAEATGLSYLPPQIAGGSLLHVTNAVNVPPILTFDSFGAFAPLPTALVGRRFRGTVSSPAVVQSGDAIIGMTASGYATAPTVTGLAQVGSARFVFVADETFTSTSQAGRLDFYTQTPGGNGTEHKVLVVNSGGIVLPNVALGGLGNASITFADGSVQTTAANIVAINANIATLTANAAGQQTQINSITANAVTAVTAGLGITVSRTGGNVGINSTGVQTVAGTENQITVVDSGSKNLTLSLPQGIATNSSPTFGNLLITGNLNVQGNIVSFGAASIDTKILYLANTATSSDQIDGGGINLGDGQAFARDFTYDLTGDRWTTGTAGLFTNDLDANEVHIAGNLFANGSAHFGGSYIGFDFPNAEVQVDCNVNSYNQIVGQNHNSGTNASLDFVGVNDIGDDENHYIDMGINSSTYNNPDYSVMGPNDGYLYVNGGNLTVGTQTAGQIIKFHTGGTTASNLRVIIDDNGLAVVGNVSANYLLGNGAYLTGMYGNANVASYLSTDANVTAIWANIASINSAWQANAGQQANQITGANAAIVTANTGMKSYSDYQDGLITTAWTANAVIQAGQINDAFTAVITANSAVVSYVNTLNSAMISNVNAANSAIVTANTGMKSYVDALNSAMIGNVNAANAAIVTANSAVVSYVNTQIGSVSSSWTANAAVQEIEISELRANITAANSAIVSATYGNANVAAYLPVDSTIITINSNITGANAAIVTANTGMKSYVDYQDGLITTAWTANAQAQESSIAGLRANITAANSAIVTANSAVVSYVNDQIGSATANAAGQSVEISGLRANITAANLAIQTISANLGAFETYANATFGTSSYGNTQVAAYLPIYTGNIGAGNIVATGNVTAANFIGNLSGNININSTATTTIKLGNITIVDQTITGTVSGRPVTFNTTGGSDFVFGSNIVPSLHKVYTLGTKTARWAKAYHGPNSLDVDGILIETRFDSTPGTTGNMVISNATSLIAPSIQSNTTVVSAGNVTTSSYFIGDGSKLTNLPTGPSGIVAGVVSIDPASVGKNAVATQTFTIAGLTTSHRIVITPATALTYGVFITAAWVSDTDTVSIQFMNISGGSINLGAIDINYYAWL